VVSLESADGTVLARAPVAGVSPDRWRRYEVSLTTPAESPRGTGNRIVVAAESRCARGCRAMTGEAVWPSVVSVFPPTYKGHGLRTDIMNRTDVTGSLIGVDAATSYGSPSYHVQRMFAERRGDHVADSRLTGGDPAVRTVVTRAGRTLYVKVVNSSATAQPFTVEVTGVRSVARTGAATVLTGDPPQRNTDPGRIRPRTVTAHGLASRFDHTFPAHSFTILTLTVSS
jgi:hypothetical protein